MSDVAGYHNIPNELRELRQWVCWRYEDVNGRRTKVPYAPNGQFKANVNNPATWGGFDEACVTALSSIMDGIGFVLTEYDPYTGIDIDDKLENPASDEERAMHGKILEAFQSYTERSVGGRGYHIIIRGKIAAGRDRGHVGVYSTQRYLTFSGDVVRNAPIGEYQEYLDELVRQMPVGEDAGELHDVEAILDDNEVIDMAMSAANGDKFEQLCKGNWEAMGYASQSEADLALMSMLAFYTRDNKQALRIFRMTELGKREKATRNNVYITRTLRKARAGQATPADFSLAQANAARIMGVVPPLALPALPVPVPATPVATQAAACVVAAPARPQGGFSLPPGLVGELASYFHSTAIRPTQEMALAAAIGIAAGVAGRCYNISDTGLNQYILFIAETGTGKEGIQRGITKLLKAARTVVPMVGDFLGPGAFASGQGLIKTLDSKPSFVSILGEFGLQLQALTDPRAPAAMVVLRKVLLDLYGKSGWDDVLQSTAYSDIEKNTKIIAAPAVTILGESTPEEFYDALDSSDIASGLVPRFHIIEYKGQRPSKNPHAAHAPSPELVRAFANLVSVAVTCQNNHTCAAVQIDPQALHMLDAFDLECDEQIRSSASGGEKQLWNRAHLKALKLAGLLAVGCNPHAPTVTTELAQWAIDFTRTGTEQVLRRFEIGDFGKGEQKQVSELRRVIDEYFKEPAKTLEKYKCKPEMRKEGVIPYAYLYARLNRVASFYKDRQGTVKALRSLLENMVQAEILGQVTPLDAHNKFDARQKLYYLGKGW